MRVRPLILLITAAALPSTGASDADLARGAEILLPFKRELQRALQEGLAGGPEAAIAACRTRAPEIAASISRDGVRVGRTSHRLRNPANAAPAWVAPLLDRAVSDAAQRAPQTVALSADRRGYVEPITVQPMCLTCHGEALSAAISSRLEALYPEDRAVGFRVGDFRGLFWAEFGAAP